MPLFDAIAGGCGSLLHLSSIEIKWRDHHVSSRPSASCVLCVWGWASSANAVGISIVLILFRQCCTASTQPQKPAMRLATLSAARACSGSIQTPALPSLAPTLQPRQTATQASRRGRGPFSPRTSREDDRPGHPPAPISNRDAPARCAIDWDGATVRVAVHLWVRRRHQSSASAGSIGDHGCRIHGHPRTCWTCTLFATSAESAVSSRLRCRG